jgi:hypothetical protein
LYAKKSSWNVLCCVAQQQEEFVMTNRPCETCGNTYDKSFSILMDDQEHVFDSFECAIQKMALHCEQCDTRIIGHGVEESGHMYCCAHCARHDGQKDLTDRVDERDSSHLEFHII